MPWAIEWKNSDGVKQKSRAFRSQADAADFRIRILDAMPTLNDVHVVEVRPERKKLVHRGRFGHGSGPRFSGR